MKFIVTGIGLTLLSLPCAAQGVYVPGPAMPYVQGPAMPSYTPPSYGVPAVPSYPSPNAYFQNHMNNLPRQQIQRCIWTPNGNGMMIQQCF